MKNDGGQAFPGKKEDMDGFFYYPPSMTLRDYFAGQALIGLTTGVLRGEGWLGQRSYEVADAMLKARGEGE